MINNKIVSGRTIKAIANKLEVYLPYGEAIKLIEIHREIDKLGYKAFDKRTNNRVKKVSRSMGWKIAEIKIRSIK